jgi:hypothetical protein
MPAHFLIFNYQFSIINYFCRLLSCNSCCFCLGAAAVNVVHDTCLQVH